jgi:hypothetical protein
MAILPKNCYSFSLVPLPLAPKLAIELLAVNTICKTIDKLTPPASTTPILYAASSIDISFFFHDCFSGTEPSEKVVIQMRTFERRRALLRSVASLSIHMPCLQVPLIFSASSV